MGEKGWWFRLPKVNPNGKESPPIRQDVVMPQLGRLFGLAEEAAALVLVEMGLMTRQNDGRVVYKESGWNEFSNRFMVGDVVEACRVYFDENSITMLDLGWWILCTKVQLHCGSNTKKNTDVTCPISLCNRKTTSFISGELRSILVQSEFFDSLSQISYYGDGGDYSSRKMRIAKENGLKNNQQSVKTQPLTSQKVAMMRKKPK